MAWLFLLVAGALEIVWAGLLKYTDGFTRVVPTSFLLIAMAGSVLFLSLATRTLPLGTAYAVWCGIGIIGTTTIGIVMNGEPVDPFRLGCIAMIGAGVIGLKLLA